MIEPSTAAGRRGLDALRSSPSEALVALDYDGTLARIVEDPLLAVPAPGAVEALVALAPKVGQLAVVTGRPADVVVDLGGLASVPGLMVLGQYGAQRWEGGRLSSAAVDPGVVPARQALRAVALMPGAAVEDKGLSLSVHTRRCDDPVVAMARLHPVLLQIAADTGLTLHLGRLVLELRPAGFDKGHALQSLLGSHQTVVFAGDDVGDLAAFDAVEEARFRGGAGLLICSDSAEGPPELRERADLVVPGPAGVVALLRELL